jgi:photosystem II stability/assembly factor-like uncharacterized protein
MKRFHYASLPLLLLLVVVVSVPLLSSQETGQGFDAKFFEELRWRSIGPFRGGRSVAATGVPGQPEVYYFGAVEGGVWKTDDAGRTWQPIFDAENVASIGAIAVAPSNTNVIYVGTGEADLRSSLSSGNGIYKSSDGGKTWMHIGLSVSKQIARILVDPENAEHVYVAALGHAYGPNVERGVFESEDGGKSWRKILYRDENTGAIDLAFEPGNPKTIYAALLQTRRPPWSIYAPSKGPGSGLYRSTDGGEHWEQIEGHGLPSREVGRIGIAFAPSNPRRIYLIVDADRGGLYRSEDGGANWALVSDDRRIWQRGWYFGEVRADPKDADTVYVMNTTTYKSRDGGRTFTAFKGAPGGDDYHDMWIDPAEPERMILSSDQGVIITRNRGRTWSSWYNQPHGQFYHIITDNRFPYWVYGAQQDSGAAATPSRSNYRELNFHDWRPMEAGEENGYVAPDPLHPGVIFGGTVLKEDLDNGQNLQIPPSLAQTGNFRQTWTLPLVFSPIDKKVLYFGSQVLFRTADGGSSWQEISRDLTREDPGVPANLDAPAAADAPKEKRRGVIYTIAPSYIRAGEIWVGTDDGFIQLTQDEGKTWKNVTPPEITAWSKVTHMEASHFDAGTAYAAVDRHRLDDDHPYLYRTQDFGKTWKEMSRGIPEGSFLNCVREDPVRKGLLYACTETGVFVSFDDGEHWQSLKLNMPTVSVRDLVVHGDDLVIATFGRAIWILDDATPLRQWKPGIADAESWLFKPAAAYRIRPGSDQGSPMPFDEPMAQNPPTGAVIDYYLKEKPEGAIQLEIFDARGKLVRRFASDDKLTKTDPKSVSFPMIWVKNPQPLSAEAGMHRFVWDLRYAVTKGVPGFFGRPAGVWALPGNYNVKLTANGKSITEPLRLRMDPRVKTTAAALARQFEVASGMATKLEEVSTAVQGTEKLQEQIEARRKEADGNAELLDALEGLERKLGISNAAGGGGFGLFGLALPPKGEVTLLQARSALGRLLLVVESADVAPTTDAQTAAGTWGEASSGALARWEEVQRVDVARVNRLLEKAKLQKLSWNGTMGVK